MTGPWITWARWPTWRSPRRRSRPRSGAAASTTSGCGRGHAGWPGPARARRARRACSASTAPRSAWSRWRTAGSGHGLTDSGPRTAAGRRGPGPARGAGRLAGVAVRDRNCWPSCAGCWTATGSCGGASSCGWPRAAGTPGPSGGWYWTWCGPPRGYEADGDAAQYLADHYPADRYRYDRYLDGVREAAEAIGGLAAAGQAPDAIEIAQAAIELLAGDPERTEPRYGAVKEAAGLLLAAHLTACQAAPPDPAELGRYLAGLLGREDLAPALADYAGLLGDAGLASLRAAAVRAHERDPEDEQARRVLEAVLRAAGDVDGLVALHAAELDRHGRGHLRIARELDQAGAPATRWAGPSGPWTRPRTLIPR